MITIAHLITGLQTGGAETMLAKLVRAMDGRRFRNVVISMTDGGSIASELAGRGVQLRSLEMKRGVADPRGLARLVRLLRTERPDVLQTWLYHADLMGTIAGRIAGVPRIAWNLRCSDMNRPNYRWMSRNLPLLLARLSGLPDAVIVNSVAGRAVHESYGYRPRRWQLIPNGFDTERFRPRLQERAALRAELGLPRDAILIGLPARLDPMKDHCGFLAAAATLALREPSVHFVLMGAGLEAGNPAVMRMVGACGLADRVTLLGERRDMDRVLPALDVATLSSAFGEGFPNVLGEAMACGVPCVSTDVGDAAMIVGGTGVIVEPRDPVALAMGWRHMLRLGPEGRIALGADARARVLASFSLPVIAASYEAFYGDLAQPCDHPAAPALPDCA
ncbi:glycosyltransferase [Azospirillum halopraeferens]|uniref:glycosyltransferase n=1 Tax=Azospirillum halopraeferens TaxID=34010 RepID=UPI0003F65283|nr:glycosyltransferase [Azospirillum halopraeferens]